MIQKNKIPNKIVIGSLLALSLIFLSLTGLYSQSCYRPFDGKRLKGLIPSTSRLVVSLTGKWQISYDNEEWNNIEIPRSTSPMKKVYFRRTISIDQNMLNQYNWQLYFLGIDDQVEVYFNEQFIGRYFGGMTPFSVKVPAKFLNRGANTILLAVNPTSHTSRQIRTQNLFGPKIYTGLLRELFFVGMPHIWINEVTNKTKVTRNRSGFVVSSKINVSSGDIERIFQSGTLADSISSPGSEKIYVTLTTKLWKKGSSPETGLSKSKVITVERARSVMHNMSINITRPDLWSPGDPNLYILSVELTKNNQLIDDYSSEIGFREVSFVNQADNPQILINGKKFKIRGVNYIEDIAGCGHTVSADRMESDIKSIKTLGANLVRFKYTAPHPYILSLCDKYGLFALVELPVYNVPSAILSLDEIKVRMKNLTKRFLSAYSNVSILAWGLSEGAEEDSKRVQNFYKSISGIIKSESEKPIYKTVHFGSKTIETKGFDLIGARPIDENYKFSSFRDEIKRLKSLTGKKPLFIIYGRHIQPENHNGYSDPLSLESQAHYIRNSFHIVNELNCAGSIVNSFNDYLIENPVLVVDNRDLFVSTSGITERNRLRRFSYSTLQALFNSEKEPLLNAGSYTEETPVVFIIVGIVLGIIIVLLINRFRRFREYLFRAVLRPYNFYADIRDQRIMSTFQTIILWIVLSTTVGIFLSSIFYFYRSNILAQYVYMLILPINSLQELFYRLIWLPELLMVFMSAVFFVFALLASFIIRIFALFVRARIFFRDTITITVWAAVPLLVILPVSIVLVRLLVFSDSLSWLVLLLLGLVYIWVWFRILRSTAVVFDVSTFRVYFFGFAVLIFLVGIVLSVYQYEFSIFSYSQYFFDVLTK